MKRILAIIALSVILPAAASAAGKIITDSIASKTLNATVKYNVYLPTGYGKVEKQYPVVYLLHGLYGSYKDWNDLGQVKLVADELISSGEADEMVIIMPNAGGKDVHKIHNGYFNVPGWNYEDFFFSEFMPEVEKKYNCISDKGHRAIMGLSMGGGGSTVYCQRHPDKFSSYYAMSAWLNTDVKQNPSEKEAKDFFYLTCLSVHEHNALAWVEEADDSRIADLRTVRWFLDCGDDDGLVYLSEELHHMMRKAKINCELRVRNGIHNWEYWHTSVRMALPFASRNFSR